MYPKFYQIMSHFINWLMPTFVFNLVFGAFIGILIYLLSHLYSLSFIVNLGSFNPV